MSRKLKVLAAIWGCLWLGAGSLAVLGFLLAAAAEGEYAWETTFPISILIVAGLGGGGLVAYASLRALGKGAVRPLRVPPAWVPAGGFILALAAGLGLWQAELSTGVLVPFFAACAGVLAPLAAATWLIRSAGQTDEVSVRRGLGALGLGATAGVILALILNTVLVGAVMMLIWGAASELFDRAAGLLDALSGGMLGGEESALWILLILVETAVLVPLTEEMVKPLALLPLLKRLPTARGALLLGALAGAGFAGVENVLYAAMFGEAWAGVLGIRALGAALHLFGAGLMAMAWRDVLRREPGAGARWFRNYGVAAGVHGLWNGTATVTVVLAGEWFGGWQVDVLGVTEGAVLLALLGLLGIGLLVALRAVGRRLAPAGEAETALPADRALAVWGVACLVVLVPAGLGLLRAVW